MASRKPATGALSNYLLQIDLIGSDNPSISRTLSVPPSTTFDTLHSAIQVAFGWRNAHTHHFDIFDAPPLSGKQEPRLLFSALPRVLVHLEPEPGESSFQERGTHYETSTVWTLSQVFEDTKYKEKRIEYLYDFGDNWVHHITLIGRANILTSTIACLSGEGGPAAEDCGGYTGWEEIKKAYREHRRQGCRCSDRQAHNKMRWYEEDCTNGRPGGAAPSVWDKERINRKLAATGH